MFFHKARRHGVRLLLTVLLSLAASSSPASATTFNGTSIKIRVLFIGNSYTYYNNLPQIVTALATSANQTLETEMIATGGATLKKHWEDGRALEALKRGHWDYVVLQEQSTLGFTTGGSQINSPKMFHEYARLFNAEIIKVGAKTVFFLTWARQNLPQTQAALTEAYLAIAKELKAIVAPVGIAWQRALKNNPSLALHQKDLSHPTPMGSYLSACVIVTTLFGKTSVRLTPRVLGNAVDATGRVLAEPVSGGNGNGTVELVSLSKSESAFLQQIARETAIRR